jgi:DNA-binding beta-propeller fold protein YncE
MRALTILALLATTASAGKIEGITKVKRSDQGITRMRQVGDSRYLAVSTLSTASATATVDVLDLESQTISQVSTTRSTLERSFGAQTEGELVMYTTSRAAFHVSSHYLERGGHHWYVELDPKTGKLGRTVSLGQFGDETDYFFIGTDPLQGAAWFYYLKYGETTAKHTHGPKELVLQRVDTNTLALTEVMTIALPARAMKSGYEDRLTVHHAPDFTRFAVVEYDEHAFKTKPAGQVYVVDPDKRTTFSIPALDTNYGVAFSRDGAYIYLASSQLGSIARVDIAKQTIDKTVSGPSLTHDIVISPNGGSLFVIGSAKTYTEVTLPALSNRTSKQHSALVAPGAAQLSGAGQVSQDGRYYVLPEAMKIEKDHSVKLHADELVIARLAD